MSRNKHRTQRQHRGNGWLDPRGTKEAHESRDMTNRKNQPMAMTRQAKRPAAKKQGARR